jgi:hypothetical protein
VIVAGLLIRRLPARDRAAPARSNARPGVEPANRPAATSSMAAGTTPGTAVGQGARHAGTATPTATAGAGTAAAGAAAGPHGPRGRGAPPGDPAERAASNGAGWRGTAAHPPAHGSGFSARLDGRLWQGPNGDGAVLVALDGALHSGFDGELQLRVFGRMAPGTSQLEVVDNRLWLLGRDGTMWTGRIELFDSLRLRGAIIAQTAGARPLRLEIELFGFSGEATSGTVRALPNGATGTNPMTSSLAS